MIELEVVLVVVCYGSFCVVVVELGMLILVLSVVVVGLEVWFGVCLFNCMMCSVFLLEVGMCFMV